MGVAGMDFWIVQTLNGVSFGLLLFLLAGGLTLIFGLMKILNLMHGSFYLLGAYLALTIVRATGNFLLAAVAAAAFVALLGILVERFFFKRFSHEMLAQVLLSMGFIFVIQDVAQWIWGGYPQMVPKPAFFSSSVEMGPVTFPRYRFLVGMVGLAMAGGLWVFQEKTRMGAVIRAAVDEPEMVMAVGRNVPFIFTAVFAFGAFLGGLGGALGGGFMGAYVGADFEVLLLAFIVVIVGGLGSLKGAFIGSLLVGLIDTFGRSIFPELSYFTLFAPMVIILSLRPRGLFGKE